ncbi:MAG TPA: YlxR family protein [Clostridia bacterium]|nr:YlxR family protein [Clostridia bacterium]
MKKRKTPLRKCVGCGQLKDKRELIRLVRSKEGHVSIDPTGKLNGRGAYLCKDKACFEQALKEKGLQRSFKSMIKQETIDELRQKLGK